MLRLSLVALLVSSITANFVFGMEIVRAEATNSQNESPVGTNRSKETPKVQEVARNVTGNNATLGEDQKKAESSKEQATNSTVTTSTNRNETAASAQNVSQSVTRPIEETTPTVNKDEEVSAKAGNFTGEQANLNECCVAPPDEEEEDATTIESPKEKPTSTDSTLGTTPASTVVTTSKSTSVTDIDPPKVFPVTKDVQSIETAGSDIIAKLNLTLYKTVAPELADVTEPIVSQSSKASATTPITPNVTTNATVALNNATATPEKNQTESGNKNTMVEGLEGLRQAELTEKGKESSDGSMPSGIIALVTAITFAAAIVIGYISMIVWKQYLEHRYGRRELLVNELEFDTNDLRHFEL